MAQFYIDAADPEADVRRCHDSMRDRQRITITGATLEGRLLPFTGVVQAIEDNGEGAPRGKRWRVTMQDL